MSVTRSPQNRAIRVALEANDMDRRELARRTGLHQITISKVCNGELRLSYPTALRVAGVLGSSPEALGLTKKSGEA